MQRQGEKNNGQPMSAGSVVSVDPLRVRYNNVVVSDGIRCRLPQMPETIRQMIDEETGIQPELKEFLSTIYDAFNLQEGDSVIVQKAGNELYILGKA